MLTQKSGVPDRNGLNLLNMVEELSKIQESELIHPSLIKSTPKHLRKDSNLLKKGEIGSTLFLMKESRG
jgi:hypothetical protein